MRTDAPAGSGLDAEAVKAAVLGDRFLALADALGAKGRKKSGATEWRCACFLHGGDGPNLALNPSKGKWNCLSSCGGGDALELVQRAKGLDFRAALEWLADFAGIKPSTGEWVKPEPVGRVWTPPPPPAVEVLEVEAFTRALWSVVADAPWSPKVARWLGEVRGIDPGTAYALGCRDWTTRRGELAELMRSTPARVLEAAGLVHDDYWHPAVRGVLDADPAWSNVAVPVWRLAKDWPERWRWRYLEAPPKRPKSDDCFGTGAYPSGLLGAGRPGRLEGAEVRLAWLGSGVPGADVLVLVEGEPDWWAATEVVDGRAVVLGVCGGRTAWADAWPTLLELVELGVRRVIVAVHHGKPGPDGLGHGARFAASVAAGCMAAGLGRGVCVRKLAAEGRDLNDLHRAGELAGWFADVL